MALFTDGPISTMDDLTAQDSSALDVASGEGVDLTRKLRLAQDEIGVDLTAVLSRLALPDGRVNTQVPDLGTVAVTPPLKLWHTLHTLELLYRDAFDSQLNDRYRGRRDQYHALSRWAADKLWQIGIGVVVNPVPRAAQPSIVVTNGSLLEGTYFVSVAWVSAQGDQGASSFAQPVSVDSAHGLVIDAGAAPAVAVGWNVFAGATEDSLHQQNSSLLGIGSTWYQGTAPATSGPAPGNGQSPSYLRPAPRILQRG
jgi:hypothetical protein